jgi:tetratricopeptide (TPR) repeat protein
MPADAGDSQAESKAKIFISYSRKDLAVVDRLDAALKARGFEPLIDRSEISVFEDWWKRIEGLIGKADTVVFALSPDAVASEICAKEVAYAASLNKRFAPIVCRRVPDAAVPEVLRRFNFAFFDDPDQFDATADRLADALTTDIGWIRQHTEFGEAARHWVARGRPGGLLLRSPALEEAEHWIASRPPNAPMPTAETQAFVADSRRGASRRRNVLTGSLAAGLVLALGLAGLAYWQREVAVTERQHAVTSLNAATRTSNSLIYDLADRFRHQSGVPAAVVKDIIGRAQKLQEELVSSGQTSPDLRDSQASALSEVSLTLMTLGDRAGALAAADQARQILEDLLAKSPDNAAWQLDLGVAYQRIGVALVAEGKGGDAITAFEKARAIHQKLVDADGGNDKAQKNLAADYFNIGRVREDDGKLDDALAAFQRDAAIMQMLVKRQSLNADWWRDLGVAYEQVGRALFKQHKLDQALTVYRKRLEIAQALSDQAPTNTEYLSHLSVAHNKMGDVLLEQRQPEQALDEYRKALAIREKLLASDQANVNWLRDVAIGDNMVALALANLGKLDQALASFQKALAVEEQLAARDPGNVLWQQDLFLSYTYIGGLLVRQKESVAGLKAFRDGLAVAVRQAGPHPDNAYWQSALRYAARQIGAVAFDLVLARNFDLALQAAEQAAATVPDMIWIQSNRAHALMFLNRTDEARALYLQYRGRQHVDDQKSWEALIAEDFTQLRRAGLEAPLMDEIEKKFAEAG